MAVSMVPAVPVVPPAVPVVLIVPVVVSVPVVVLRFFDAGHRDKRGSGVLKRGCGLSKASCRRCFCDTRGTEEHAGDGAEREG
jgi:hypothetical protein